MSGVLPLSGDKPSARSRRRGTPTAALRPALVLGLVLFPLLSMAGASTVWAQTAASDSTRAVAPVKSDSAARAALLALLADGSTRNVLPRDLQSYKAGVETELSVLLRREDGTEVVTAMEQVASNLRWTRAGLYEQHVIGYRAVQTGPNVSLLSAFQTGWLNPSLYGNRLRVRSQNASANSSARADSARAERPVPSARSRALRNDSADTLPAIHPLAADREQYYRYSGGDTVVTIRVGAREIPIVQVRVTPRRELTIPVLLFDGEIDLDASRGTLVRMRGTFVRLGKQSRSLTSALTDAVAFVEYEQGERMGAYWLPSKQRIEVQVSIPAIGDARIVVRIASKFSDMMVNDTLLSAETLAASDSLRGLGRRRLSFASPDSMGNYAAWRGGIGSLSEGMHADDFLDVAPDRWRPYGAPRLDWVVTRASDVFHFNRVEGVYVGYGAKLAMRDVAPGVVMRGNIGYAWSDRAVRGRVSVEEKRGPWLVELRAGRSMDNTNDFRVAFDSGTSLGALIGSNDPYDYVDRTSATLAGMRTVGKRDVLLRASIGVAHDGYRPSHFVRGPFGGAAFRPNRGVDEGSYVHSAASLEWHPDVSAEFVKPGLSARLLYDRGDGTLKYQRIETRLVARQPIGPFVAIMRGEAGTVLGDKPPAQQLFELGERQNLPGYADKEFAGTRAAVLRASLQYTSPFFKQPIRIGRFFFPAVAPGASVGVQSGWTEAPNDAARAAIARLAVVDPNTLAIYAPVSRPTDGIRASVTAGLRFFSGSVFMGMTRPVDQAAKWRTLITIGQQW